MWHFRETISSQKLSSNLLSCNYKWSYKWGREKVLSLLPPMDRFSLNSLMFQCLSHQAVSSSLKILRFSFPKEEATVSGQRAWQERRASCPTAQMWEAGTPTIPHTTIQSITLYPASCLMPSFRSSGPSQDIEAGWILISSGPWVELHPPKVPYHPAIYLPLMSAKISCLLLSSLQVF